MNRLDLETTMGALIALANNLRDDMAFDEADTVESALPFLAKLGSLGVLPEPIIDTTPINPTMDTLRNMCVEMRRLQNITADLKVQIAEAKMPLDDLRLKKIPEMMQQLEVTTTTFAGLGRVQLAGDLYASTRKGKKDDAMQWLRDCGHGSLIKEGYNASSVKAIFRGYLKEGTEIPDDIFSVTPFIRASIVKA